MYWAHIIQGKTDFENSDMPNACHNTGGTTFAWSEFSSFTYTKVEKFDLKRIDSDSDCSSRKKFK